MRTLIGVTAAIPVRSAYAWNGLDVFGGGGGAAVLGGGGPPPPPECARGSWSHVPAATRSPLIRPATRRAPACRAGRVPTLHSTRQPGQIRRRHHGSPSRG